MLSLQHAAPEGPPRLSIVVLPFANIGGDPGQEYFADGVTESLTTDLSRMGGMLVIGRNTAFTYKGKHVDLKQIGRELGVRYVLEGSVQRGGNRMRVNCAACRRRDRQSACGPSVSTSPWPISSTCRTKSLRALPGNWERKLVDAEARRVGTKHQIPIPWTFISRVWLC